MTEATFSLTTRSDVERFEQLMLQYSKTMTGVELNHISLLEAWDDLHRREDGGRIFTSLLDIYVNIELVFLEFTSVAGVWNDRFSKGKLEGGSILDSQGKFFGKFDIHRSATAFVFRYRAVWDKILGLLVLLFAPDEYERFAGAKSRQKVFRSIASKIQDMPAAYVADLLSELGKFDNTFRTAEAHGTGTIRKWSLTMQGIDENPMIDLFGHWNFLNSTAIAIATMLKSNDPRDIEPLPPAL